jgi:iron complex outermembrane recepter protein
MNSRIIRPYPDRALIAVAAGAVMLAAPAWPDDNPGTQGLQEIIVTAQKRAESLQTVPEAITALTAQNLEALGAVDLTTYARTVPGLTFTDLGTGRQTVAIRGLNASLGSATVSYYIDETPIPAEQGNIPRVQTNPNLVDIDRIEVLRGPQGTLYGSSAMGGTIRLIPTEVDLAKSSGYVDVGADGRGAGSWGVNTTLVGNLPLVQDVLGMRAALWYRQEDGFINRLWGPNTMVDPTEFQGEQRNIGTQDIKGGRLRLLFKPNDALSVSGMVYHEDRSANGLGDYTGGALNPTQALNQIQLADISEPSSNSFTLSNVTAKLTLGNINVTSSSSYYDSRTFITEEGTAVADTFFGVFFPSRFDEHHTDRNVTQELRMATIEPISGVGVIAGIYYNEDHNKQTFSYPAPGWNQMFAPTGPNDPSGLYAVGDDLFSGLGYGYQRELSEFGELSYNFTQQLKLTVGTRHYYIDNSQYSTSAGLVQSNEVLTSNLGANYTGTLYKGNLSYQITEDQMVYAQYSEGFRPGFPLGPLPSICQSGLAAVGITSPPNKVNPDNDKNYEIGAKTSWLDRRLTIDVALYRIDWENIQQELFLPCGEFFDANAGQAVSKGVEFEVDGRITERLGGGVSGSYDRATLSQNEPTFGALSGDQLNDVPVQQGAAHVDYSFPLRTDIGAVARVDVQYTGSSYANYLRLAGTSERDPAQRLGALTLLNARLTFNKDNWTASLFADNVLDRIARQDVQNSLLAQIPGRPRYVPNMPRTIGINVRRNF